MENKLKKLLKFNGKSTEIVDNIMSNGKDYHIAVKETLEWIQNNFDCEPNGGVIDEIEKLIKSLSSYSKQKNS